MRGTKKVVGGRWEVGGGRAKGGERVNRLSVVGGAVEVGGKANVERNTITNVQQGMSNIQLNIPAFPWTLGIECWLWDIHWEGSDPDLRQLGTSVSVPMVQSRR